MLESVVGQRAGSTPLKKAKCTIAVYSIDEFIPSQLPERLHSQLGRCYTLSARRRGQRVESAAVHGGQTRI
jgi:hypothetical protein